MIRRPAWTTGDVRRLRECRAAGYSALETAQVLGRTTEAVKAYLAYLKRNGETIPKLPAYDRREREAA
jgi:predicted transcriptional regulator